MAKYAERGGLTQSRHDFTTPMPSETAFRRHLFCRHSDKRAGIPLLNRQTEAYC
ncbi:hypothetical protein [Neisseria gonorrhoeae]|uniref:hypothetical protein n=1 Tax=Neisseria gonorrhoeae TaxID=485 RepID=UPI0027D9B4F9|nr:hypothetical protein [Neisseria gonorrhoeae]